MSEAQAPSFTPWATISGTKIPLESFNLTNGAYGSTGRGSLVTSIIALEALNINLIQLASAKASEVEVDVYMQQGTNSPVKIFGGEFISSSWDYDQGTVEVHMRDWAGVLIDQKKVLLNVAQDAATVVAPLEPGASESFSISSQNQTLSQLVTAIANLYSLTPVLNLQTANNPTIGQIYGNDDTIYTPVPQSLWTILTHLALDTGYEIYTTPSKQLVFGTPGAGLPTTTLNYNTAVIPKKSLACNKLTLSHNPRRNSTFRVLVISYDPGKAQATLGRADYIGADIAGAAGLSAGLVSGASVVNTDATLAKLESQLGKIPLYSFHVDGLTAAQAQTKATAIATDIAKREFMMSVEIDGLSTLLPTQMLKLTGNVDPAFLGQTYYCTSYTHSFKMPKSGKSLDDGYSTTIQALNFPISGQGLPTGSQDQG